jgi:CDP-diacylglycerol--serine O-phosphatidyltransferase
MTIYILPNIFTTGNMFFGFFSMVQSLAGNYVVAAYAIVGSAVFDLLDGRVARMTHSTSKFGMEYDSLSDLVSFGVAPAILLYTWALKPFDRIGWLACFMYMACGALRLARFNVQVATVEKRFFQGLPIPMAAGIVATSVTAAQSAGIDPHRNIYVLAMAILLGFVMVSNFRYRSFKELDFRQRKPFYVLIAGLCVIVFIAVKPEVHLFIAFITYAVLGALFGIITPARKKLSQVIIAESARRQQGERATHDENDNEKLL